jgi:transcription elongation factor GreB
MSRYRPPAKKSSPYITPEGARALREELSYLWKEKRPEVTKAVSEAAALGDRSENAEYIYGKKMLREIDRRVRFLTKRLDEVQIVDRLPENPDKVYFGASIHLESIDGVIQRCFRIVGADEFDPSKGWISVDSPFSRRVIGRGLDDEIELVIDGEEQTFLIVDITYPESLQEH